MDAKADTVVSGARRRFDATIAEPQGAALPDHGSRRGAYLERMRGKIAGLNSAREALHYAQTKVGFGHRDNIHHEGKFTALYESAPSAAFAHYRAGIDHFANVAPARGTLRRGAQ